MDSKVFNAFVLSKLVVETVSLQAKWSVFNKKDL